MFNFGLLDLNSDDSPSMADFVHPFIHTGHAQPLRHRLIDGIGAYFDCMLHAMQIATSDLAGSQRHEGSVACSLFIRHQILITLSSPIEAVLTPRCLSRWQTASSPFPASLCFSSSAALSNAWFSRRVTAAR